LFPLFFTVGPYYKFFSYFTTTHLFDWTPKVASKRIWSDGNPRVRHLAKTGQNTGTLKKKKKKKIAEILILLISWVARTHHIQLTFRFLTFKNYSRIGLSAAALTWQA
jgi:hypothetical protein